jgi:hypothetical protein
LVGHQCVVTFRVAGFGHKADKIGVYVFRPGQLCGRKAECRAKAAAVFGYIRRGIVGGFSQIQRSIWRRADPAVPGTFGSDELGEWTKDVRFAKNRGRQSHGGHTGSFCFNSETGLFIEY